MIKDARQEFVGLVVRQAFDPVMRAKAPGKSDAERDKLERVQKATRAEIDRYHAYGSAGEVVTNFKRDLNSSAAKKVHAELKSLHLPTIHGIRDEFEAKARELGVHAS